MELTVVMPCLNEAETVATCVRKAVKFIADSGISGEVVVADNGSTDGSQQLARDAGARVVDIQDKGASVPRGENHSEKQAVQSRLADIDRMIRRCVRDRAQSGKIRRHIFRRKTTNRNCRIAQGRPNLLVVVRHQRPQQLDIEILRRHFGDGVRPPQRVLTQTAANNRHSRFAAGPADDR